MTDFWTLISEKKVQTVLLLCQLVEDAQVSCRVSKLWCANVNNVYIVLVTLRYVILVYAYLRTYSGVRTYVRTLVVVVGIIVTLLCSMHKFMLFVNVPTHPPIRIPAMFSGLLRVAQWNLAK